MIDFYVERLVGSAAWKSYYFSVLANFAGFLRSRALLHLEILALRLPLTMVKNTAPTRLRFRPYERLFWVWLYRL